MAARRVSISRVTAGDNDDDVDLFDRLPDALLTLIFTAVADVETLIRCRAVSKRFNSVVPQVEKLFLKVDLLGSHDSALSGLVKSVIKSLQQMLTSSKNPQKSPAQMVRGFERVKELSIEAPAADIRADCSEFIRWKALFGESMMGCVVVGMRSVSRQSIVVKEQTESDVTRSLQIGGDWMIKAMAAAHDWHFAVREIVKDHMKIEFLEVRDKQGKGSVVLNPEMYRQCRKEQLDQSGGGGGDMIKSGVTVPAVRMVMWYQQKVVLEDGTNVEGAMVVVARPLDAVEIKSCSCCAIHEELGLTRAAFGGMYGEIVQCLVKERYRMFHTPSF